MKCPRHETPLRPTTEKGYEIDACPQCHGTWIPGELINRLIGSGQRKALVTLCDEHRTSLACPHDNTALAEATVSGVVLDFCIHCHGVWLDPGELAQLRRTLRQRPERDESQPDKFANEAIEAAGGGILEGLASVLGSLTPW